MRSIGKEILDDNFKFLWKIMLGKNRLNEFRRGIMDR